MPLRKRFCAHSPQPSAAGPSVSQDLPAAAQSTHSPTLPEQAHVLTHWPQPSRSSRPPQPLSPPPAPTHPSIPAPTFTIQSHPNTYYNNIVQDVLPLSDPVSGTPNLQIPTRNGRFIQTSPLENTFSSFQSPSQHGSLTASSTRLRTPHPVFQTTSELAAHHGIPNKLPPLPTHLTHRRPPVPRFDNSLPTSQPEQQIHSDSSAPDPDYYLQNLMSNYLSMVSQTPADATAPSSMDLPPVGPGMTVEDAAAAESIVQSMLATPWSDFLTSPFESPFDDSPLETPLQNSAGLDDFLTSPAVADFYPDQQFYPDLPLLSNPSAGEAHLDAPKMSVASMQAYSTPVMQDYDNYYDTSPYTPSLDAHSNFPNSPVSPLPPSSFKSSRSQKQRPTGTRKNVTPDALVPVDAPTQPRTYVTESTTSRKALPAVFMRKRQRAVAFGEEEDELVDEDPSTLPPTANEADAIAAKRRQNTIAARKSRKRKLEYQKHLEDSIEREKKEKEMWMNRALMCQRQLLSFGCNVRFDDEQ